MPKYIVESEEELNFLQEFFNNLISDFLKPYVLNLQMTSSEKIEAELFMPDSGKKNIFLLKGVEGSKFSMLGNSEFLYLFRISVKETFYDVKYHFNFPISEVASITINA